MWRALHLGGVAVAVLSLASVGAGCGGGDDGPAADAGPADGMVDVSPDAEDLCDGDLTVEAHMFDLEAGGNLFDVTLRDRAAPATAATSAPNGRVLLCMARAAAVDVEAEGEGLALRADRISAAALGRLRSAGEAHPIGMFTEARVASLVDELAVPAPDAEAAWVVVHALGTADGEPVVGATVELAADHGDVFTRQADGGFVPGAAIAAGGAVLFTDVAAATGAVTLTPPDGFAGDCGDPAELADEPAALKGAAFACE